MPTRYKTTQTIHARRNPDGAVIHAYPEGSEFVYSPDTGFVNGYHRIVINHHERYTAEHPDTYAERVDLTVSLRAFLYRQLADCYETIDRINKELANL